jgi:ribosomal protein L37E
MAVVLCQISSAATTGDWIKNLREFMIYNISDPDAAKMQTPKCFRCGNEMEEVLLDAFSGGTQVATWIAGAPEHGMLGGVKFRGKKAFVPRTFRCIACGFLESYALGEVQVL